MRAFAKLETMLLAGAFASAAAPTQRAAASTGKSHDLAPTTFRSRDVERPQAACTRVGLVRVLRRFTLMAFTVAMTLLHPATNAAVQAAQPKPGAKTPAQLQAACDKGDGEACYELGRRNEEGDGVARNPARAIKLYERSCEIGYGGNCWYLGTAYETGVLGSVDAGRAAALHRRGCDKGSGDACFSLGLLYKAGKGVPYNPAAAAAFIRKGCVDLASGFCEDSGGLALAMSGLGAPARPQASSPPAAPAGPASGIPARPQRPQPPPRPTDPRAANPVEAAKALKDRGGDAFDAGRYEQALSLFEQSYRLDPNDLTIRMLRGSAYKKLGRCKEAVADFKAFEKNLIITDSMAEFAIYSDRAYCHMELKDYEAAISDLKLQIKYKPSAWDWATLGRAYSLLNKHAEAEAALKTSVRLDPNDGYANYLMAMEYLVTKRPRDALPYLRTTVRLEPDNEGARNLLATTERELAANAGTPAPARAAPSTPAQTTSAAKTPSAPAPRGSGVATPRAYPPIDPNSTLGRGVRLYHDLEYQRAWPVLLEATRADPQDARGFAYLGAAYYWLGMQAESAAARGRALALDPGILSNPAFKF